MNEKCLSVEKKKHITQIVAASHADRKCFRLQALQTELPYRRTQHWLHMITDVICEKKSFVADFKQDSCSCYGATKKCVLYVKFKDQSHRMSLGFGLHKGSPSSIFWIGPEQISAQIMLLSSSPSPFSLFQSSICPPQFPWLHPGG